MKKHFVTGIGDIPKPGQNDLWPIFIPTAVTLISCINKAGRTNIIPLTGWGVLCRYPFMIGIGICNDRYSELYYRRHSYDMIKETMEFVFNVPDKSLEKAISITGSLTANDPKIDKWKEANLTPVPATMIKSPLIAECPLNYECIVRQFIVTGGSHDIFIGEVVAAHLYGEIVKAGALESLNEWIFKPYEKEPVKKLTWTTLATFEKTE